MFSVQEVCELVRGALGCMPSTLHMGHSMDVVRLQSIARTVDSPLFAYPGQRSPACTRKAHIQGNTQERNIRIFLSINILLLISYFSLSHCALCLSVCLPACLSVYPPACVSVCRVSQDSTSCGITSYPPSPTSAERASDLLWYPQLNLLHYQDQLSGTVYTIFTLILYTQCIHTLNVQHTAPQSSPSSRPAIWYSICIYIYIVYSI